MDEGWPSSAGQDDPPPNPEVEKLTLPLPWYWLCEAIGAVPTAAGTGAKICWLTSAFDSSVQIPSTVAFRPLLNMSPIMIMPPRDHWPMPPSSGCENCAMLPPPALTAASSDSTAFWLTP